jgi:ATP-dependent Clp protease ATP-binding subunit ClpC
VNLLELVRQLFGVGPEPISIRYTPRAEKVIEMAAEAAKRQNRRTPTVNELAIALLEFNSGVAANVLKRFEFDIPSLKQEVLAQPVSQSFVVLLPVAQEEQRNLFHEYLGTEHLLLALIRHGDNPICVFLRQQGITPEILREEVLKELDPNFDPES